jgi:hypothetical protein
MRPTFRVSVLMMPLCIAKVINPGCPRYQTIALIGATAWNVFLAFQVLVSKSKSRASSPPVASSFPLEENEMQFTESTCPVSVHCCWNDEIAVEVIALDKVKGKDWGEKYSINLTSTSCIPHVQWLFGFSLRGQIFTNNTDMSGCAMGSRASVTVTCHMGCRAHIEICELASSAHKSRCGTWSCDSFLFFLCLSALSLNS